MEYLYIDNQDSINWVEVRARNHTTDVCIALDYLRDQINVALIEQGFLEDIVHVGLSFYHSATFIKISLAAPNWFFLRPSSTIPSTSWMASLHVLVIRKGVLDSVEIDNHYTNKHFLAADLAYQVVKGGGLVRYDPVVLNSLEQEKFKTMVSENDLRRFILRFFDKRACISAFPFSITSILFSKQIKKVNYGEEKFHILEDQKRRRIESYTAIIPTLSRYAYLKKAIYSLLNNPVAPAEIIVVDQTPEIYRIPGYYDEFDPALVKIFFLDKAGQSSARNHAINQATHEWLLFFDDDSEAWDEMIAEHIRLLEYSVADVSTGISLAPWKDRSYIGKSISFYQLISVLDTGNCMIQKSLIQRVGMFDPAFDKGSGADDNLGKRLFLQGACIVLNPKAIRTHYKAPLGGLRTHGAWWKNKGTYFGPFPLPTESYDFLRFYPSAFYLRLCLYRLVTSYRRSGLVMNVINTLLFPLKVLVSYQKAKSLLKIGLIR